MKKTARTARAANPRGPAPPAPVAPQSPSAARRRVAAAVPAVAGLSVAILAWSLLRAPARPDAGPPGPAPEGMVWIPAGQFRMGADDIGDATPVHLVRLDGFWIGATEVTNDQFARFVAATGYLTVAERAPDPAAFPGADPADLVPGSIVFRAPDGPASLDRPLEWWRYVAGADWRHPEGPGSTIDGKGDHPAVHICWDDAVAYADWTGGRLPTEAEWEYAARGGLVGMKYAWGDSLRPAGAHRANVWQGEFPERNEAGDGFAATAPVRQFPPNGFGLYDVAGNVWEWCADWYRPDAYESAPARDPRGPADSLDPGEPGVPKRVQRGGSYLCAENYCTRYLVGARGKGEPSSAAGHVGFRLARSAAPASHPKGDL